MKRFILLFVIFFFTLSCNAKIITGEVEYNAERAGVNLTGVNSTEVNSLNSVNEVREEIFSSQIMPISFDFIKTRLFDANAEENISAISLGIQELNDRRVVGFSDGSYGIGYYNDPLYAWYYKQGRLVSFTKKSSEDYPCKVTKYKPDGTVLNTGYKVSDNESFIFSLDGKLIAHWKDKLCYDENNNIIMIRKKL